MRFAKFRPEHLLEFSPQEAQRPHLEWMTPEIADLAAEHFSFTGYGHNGEMVGCAGLAPIEEGALIAWAIFGEALPKYALSVTRAVKTGLDFHKSGPIFAHIHVGHANAARFAEALQFKLLETRSDLHPSGAAMHVYVRESV